jgi:hypothetical protein
VNEEDEEDNEEDEEDNEEDEEDNDTVDALDKLVRQGRGLRDDGGNVLTGETFLEQKHILEESNPSKWQKYRNKVKKHTASGYIPVDGHAKSAGGVRACLHDAVVNAADRVGVTIDRKELLKQCPATRTGNRTFDEVTSTDVVSAKVRFTNVNVDNAPGGNEAAMLSIQGGVYVVQMQVDGKQTELHACVYDSCGTLPGHKQHSGMLVDNRIKAPIYLIEPKDRASTKAKRDTLNDFYNVKKPGRVFVLQVWRIEPVEGAEITPPSAAEERQVAEIELMDVDALQEAYKDTLNRTQVTGPNARNKEWLIGKIRGVPTIRAKRALREGKQGGSPNKRHRHADKCVLVSKAGAA